MVGSNGDDRLRVSTPEFSFNLKLTEGAPPVMLGGTGLLSFELTGSSYYYSRPQMPVSGAVKLDGEILDVSGVAWFDHQWGNFEVNEFGWDWFALQLEDGTDSITPMVRDSDFDGRTTSYKVYWEGPVEITGSHAGKGFVEMSGYRKADLGTAVAR
jgi:predicted secreted hydrolase